MAAPCATATVPRWDCESRYETPGGRAGSPDATQSCGPVSRAFGASPLALLLQVAVPIARPALLAAAALAWARALGEFGATLMFAGNLVGETQTLPLASDSRTQASEEMTPQLVVTDRQVHASSRASWAPRGHRARTLRPEQGRRRRQVGRTCANGMNANTLRDHIEG